MTAFEELIEYNLIKEYNGIKKLKEYGNKSKFNDGRLLIFDYILTCVKNDRENGDYYSEENNNKLKEAGKLLNEDGGIKSMRDPLLWLFIPKRYEREIDYAFDGIGEWKS